MVPRAVASSDFNVIGIWPTFDDRQQTDGELELTPSCPSEPRDDSADTELAEFHARRSFWCAGCDALRRRRGDARK